MKQSEIKNLSLEDLRDKLVESQKQLTDYAYGTCHYSTRKSIAAKTRTKVVARLAYCYNRKRTRKLSMTWKIEI